MAIDGPAPRAKMNQQRARRFRSAKDSVYHHLLDISTYKKEKDSEALSILRDPEYLQKRDTNVITPGTEFMYHLGQHLIAFIETQQKTVPAWHDIKIILSDSSVPGEGEHKIMDFIRSQRLQSCYDPNRHHCIYGLDADLIFLGLITHELYFTVIRENVLENVDGFQFVNLWVLRQFLERDLKPSSRVTFEWNFERALEDFVFLCFTAGNDFIPNIPGLNIAAQIINTIMVEYSQTLPKLGGYIIEDNVPNYKRFVQVIKGLTKFEKRELENILHPNETALACQCHVNEICNTENLSLKSMTYPTMTSKQTKVSPHPNDITPITNEMKQQYYVKKFGENVNPNDVAIEYFKGMCWVFKYYTHGVPSWDWYYPYHYPPLLSQFLSVDNVIVEPFVLNKPLLPLEQLMAVLPPQSTHCIPKKMAELMVNDSSPLICYYPKKFTVDLNGGVTTWKGIVNVPFIDTNLLLDTLNGIDLELTQEEKKRNCFGCNKVFLCEELKDNMLCGPEIWGNVKYICGNMYEFEFSLVGESQDLCFLLLNLKAPPNVINEPFDLFERMRRNRNQKNQKLKAKIPTVEEKFNLAIPGVPQAATNDYRINRVRTNKPNVQAAKKKQTSSFLF
ncbi:XRN 5'-3' exonuclease N-terminus family protein [Histomonas meleagridis]|uniref:XRN 5'-3' exonuclease N-terminus family protein n=1 Tax=Histomonas meleagridis TaxID=135588 RepID=UPI003559405C|nr:XRN 5'-3' exonuclease N-terminus family protein [Histomonas meleagridis]KAH0802982.1 XRN 5'-3' exonuclease N-terminus family protein [Histomonas meleagridis]